MEVGVKRRPVVLMVIAMYPIQATVMQRTVAEIETNVDARAHNGKFEQEDHGLNPVNGRYGLIEGLRAP